MANTETGTSQPMHWIAHNPSIFDHLKNREQFNGDAPAWGESQEDHDLKQNIDVPMVGDELWLRMGSVVVESRRLCCPEEDEEGRPVTGWYWHIIVRTR